MLKFNLSKIKVAFTLVLIILSSGYALSLGFQSEIMILSVMFIIVDMMMSGGKLKLTNNPLSFLVLIILQLGLALFANFDISGVAEYIRILVIYLFCYYVYISYTSKDIFHVFSSFMFFIAVVSLVFYVWTILFPSTVPTVQNGYGTKYMTCFFSFVNTDASWRNCGIFWEPSVFSAMCFLWGIVEILLIRKLSQRKMRIVVLVITLLSTYSTSGYVYLLFLLVMFLFRDDSRRYSLYRFAMSIVLLVIAVLVHFNYLEVLTKLVDINPLVFKKLMTSNVSVTDRTIGPLADLYVALRYPFGIGLTNLTSTVERVAYEVFETPIYTRTSTITYYCAAFGILSGITVMVPLVNFVKRNVKSFFLFIVVSMGLVFMSLSTPLHDSAIFILLLFIGVQENNIKREYTGFFQKRE